LILTLLPYLGIPNLEQTIISALYRSLPDQAAELFTSTVTNVVSERRGGLLSFAILGTIWAASSGLQVVMEQIHATYDGQDKRPYWKRRGIAILLVFAVGLLVVGAFGLVLVGDLIHDRLTLIMGPEALFLWLFPALRWGTIWLLMLSALSLFYYYGPDIRQRYRLITPGAVLATFLFIAASLGFRTYVTHFGSYEATYGSLGAVIVLLIWLYVGGLVVLIGAEVNGLLEGYCYQQKLAKSVRSQTKS
jgi:membrane protein